jgi:PAS domain S-box-containing protein
LAAIVETSDDAVIGADPDGRITSWNGGARQIFGYRAGEAIGQPISIALPTGEQARADQLLARVRTGERVRVDGAAHRRTDRMVVVVESVDEAIVSTTLDGTITSWNPAAERIYGYSAAEMIGHSSEVLVPPGRGDDQRGLLAAVASGGRPLRIETTRRRKDGSPIEVAATLSPVHDAAGAVVGLAALARDITEEERAEHERGQALEELERLAQAAEFGSDAVISLDLEMRV